MLVKHYYLAPPFGPVAVDDEGNGLGGLFEVKNNQNSILTALTLVPAAASKFRNPPPPSISRRI